MTPPDPLDEMVLVERRRLKQAADIGYQAGHAAARAEAKALLRDVKLCLQDRGEWTNKMMIARIDAYLAGGGK